MDRCAKEAREQRERERELKTECKIRVGMCAATDRLARTRIRLPINRTASSKTHLKWILHSGGDVILSIK
jgi:hypothetical protein